MNGDVKPTMKIYLSFLEGALSPVYLSFKVFINIMVPEQSAIVFFLAFWHRFTLKSTGANSNTVSQVWSQSYANKLALREETQHAQCAVCTRHKLLIKRLAGDRRLRASQVAEYGKHLKMQYSDRTEYWSARARSRLPMVDSGNTLCLIVDGMDHQKYRWPRNVAMFSSKEFHGCIRPTLDLTASIVHGHGLIMALGFPFVRKDSAWSCEIIAHSLHNVAQHHDLRSFEVLCQADNTSREVKNNCCLRFGGVMTGLHRVRRWEYRFLQSGHSHEDVDRWFSVLSNIIESHKNLETPLDFQRLLQETLQDPRHRPDETDFRTVHLVDTVRDWPLVIVSPVPMFIPTQSRCLNYHCDLFLIPSLCCVNAMAC